MNPNYTTTFTVDQTPQEAFDAINNVRGWWSQAVEGSTDQSGSVFYYHYQDVHRATFKITELMPGRKVVWHVLNNDFNFIKDKNEWIGTDVVFEIVPNVTKQKSTLRMSGWCRTMSATMSARMPGARILRAVCATSSPQVKVSQTQSKK
jgi:hypothetical protein